MYVCSMYANSICGEVFITHIILNLYIHTFIHTYIQRLKKRQKEQMVITGQETELELGHLARYRIG